MIKQYTLAIFSLIFGAQLASGNSSGAVQSLKSLRALTKDPYAKVEKTLSHNNSTGTSQRS